MNDGKPVATLSLNCIGNWWLVATLNRTGRRISNWFACSQKGGRTPRLPIGLRVLLFLRRPEALEAEDQETLALLRSLHPEVDQAYELAQQFAHMLRTRTGEQLENWLQRVRTSQIRELQGFVAGIERDKAAVIAGLTLPQNNGVVEGTINKLKLLKRMMYGRARFPLLRQRVLHAL
jgi:transposase